MSNKEGAKAVICLAVYNGEAYLKELLDSLVSQTVLVDIVAQDDYSSDNSLEILKSYSAKFPFIQILKSNENSGSASANFSKLLETVVGSNRYQHYFFADQDDVWNSDKVELLQNRIIELEVEQPTAPILVHSDLEVVDHNLEPIARSFFSYQGLNPFISALNTVLVENPATGCTMAVNHRLATVALPISEKAIMHDWWFSLVAYAVGAHVEAIDQCLVKYRQHTGNTLGAKKVSFKKIIQFVQCSEMRDLNRYYEQVQALLCSQSIVISDEKREFLDTFLRTQGLRPVVRFRYFLKYRIFKSSFLKNVGLLLLTLRQ